MFTTFTLFSAITLAAVPLSYPLVPPAVMMADEETGRLPKIFRWLETPDNLGWGAGTYEPKIKKIYDERGKRAALMHWLWRNKAYGLRWSMRTDPDYDTMTLTQYGTITPPKFGPYFWYGKIQDKNGRWFEHRQGYSFGKIGHVYVRSGWKLEPFFNGFRPKPGTTAAGMFNGITIRSDDAKNTATVRTHAESRRRIVKERN